MILLVDDQPSNIDILIEAIGDLDEVTVALNGEDALEIIKDEKPDLIFLDVIMPGMDGYEVCEKSKADESSSSIPVIFLSGNTDDEDKQKGSSVGGSDYLAKPIDTDKVRQAIIKYSLKK